MIQPYRPAGGIVAINTRVPVMIGWRLTEMAISTITFTAMVEVDGGPRRGDVAVYAAVRKMPSRRFMALLTACNP